MEFNKFEYQGLRQEVTIRAALLVVILVLAAIADVFLIVGNIGTANNTVAAKGVFLVAMLYAIYVDNLDTMRHVVKRSDEIARIYQDTRTWDNHFATAKGKLVTEFAAIPFVVAFVSGLFFTFTTWNSIWGDKAGLETIIWLTASLVLFLQGVPDLKRKDY